MLVPTITHYYENDEYKKSRIVWTPEKVKRINEEIGEILFKPKFNDMIYPDNIKDIMQLMINQIKTKPINLLFFGSAGTGKTTSAEMISAETGKPFIYLTGSLGHKKIAEMLINAKENSIILIDEIHNIPEKVAEIIYPAIQNDEIYSEGKKVLLKNLMFIGTTTEPQKLPKPLLDRFKLIEFEELEQDKLIEVLKTKGFDDKTSNLMLNFTTNFRIINNLIELMKVYGEVNEDNLIKVFRLKRINIYSGMSDLQEKYLDILKKQKKAGLRSLAIQLRKSEDYIKLEIEPDLIRKGFVYVTSRGRELSPELADYGYDELKKEGEKHHAKYNKDNRDVAIQWLKEHEGITEKLGKRYFELVNMVAEMLNNGEVPDNIDFESFGDDVSIKESKKNNYEVLDEY